MGTTDEPARQTAHCSSNRHESARQSAHCSSNRHEFARQTAHYYLNQYEFARQSAHCCPNRPGSLWAAEAVTRLINERVVRPLLNEAWGIPADPQTAWDVLVDLTKNIFDPEHPFAIACISADDYEDAHRNPLNWINVPSAGCGLAIATTCSAKGRIMSWTLIWRPHGDVHGCPLHLFTVAHRLHISFSHG